MNEVNHCEGFSLMALGLVIKPAVWRKAEIKSVRLICSSHCLFDHTEAAVGHGDECKGLLPRTNTFPFSSPWHGSWTLVLWSTRPVLNHTRYTGIPLSQTWYTHLKAILGLCVGAAGFQQDPLTGRKEGGSFFFFTSLCHFLIIILGKEMYDR